jgi:hypothetical protein
MHLSCWAYTFKGADPPGLAAESCSCRVAGYQFPGRGSESGGGALTQWYQGKFGGSRRLRRIGIVALARKLLIALWRYAEHGEIPEGAMVKGQAA